MMTYEEIKLRDDFAKAALTGICTAMSLDARSAQAIQGQALDRGVPPSIALAYVAYDYARAMMAVRSERIELDSKEAVRN